MIMFSPEIVSEILDNVYINLDKSMINANKNMSVFKVIDMTRKREYVKKYL
jgi:hypothetical protein